MIRAGERAIEYFDDNHAAAAARAAGRFVAGRVVAIVIIVIAFCRCCRERIEQVSTERELVGAMAVGKEAIVANAMEAARQHVQQEAAHELADIEAHDLALVTTAFPIIPPAESDMGSVEIEQAAVGDRDAMRIAREIGQDLLGAGEGLFDVDDPFGLVERCEISLELVGPLKRGQIAKELELAGGVHGLQTLQEQAPEQAREHANRKKEAGLAANPTPTIRR